MGPLARKDVVLFAFPYADLSNRKLRPCLVLSPEMGDDVLLCQITSQKILKDNYAVELKNKDTLAGRLQIDSFIRANKLFTADIRLVHRKIDAVNDQTYTQVVHVISTLIQPNQ
ncbi:MAG TPA: type II toxin-antitoxin system PemK/MazF family toxin [Candidatus Norongarragalinales archaeon]|nr:type II toxin-antitoxin system PemK/MazF family toxin [Candidatus Norongarragalinales archaeon]